jgi:hypothetical protein
MAQEKASPFASLFEATNKVSNDDQIIFKLPKAHREAFAELCKKHNTDMSTVLRKFVAAQVTSSEE